MVGFADAEVFVVAKDINEIQYLGDESIEVVAGWLFRHGLSPAADKTKAVLSVHTKKRIYATFTVEDKKIWLANTIKYLRVTGDAQLLFKEHLLHTGLKVSKVAQALAEVAL